MQKGIVHNISGSPQNQMKGYRTKFRKLDRIKGGQKVENTVKVMLQEESEEDTVTCATATGHSLPSQLHG